MDHKKIVPAILGISVCIALGIILFDSWVAIPLGVCYAILIPGVLLLLNIKKTVYVSWISFLCSLGLGVTLFTFLALVINVAGHALGFAKPLNLNTILIANFALIVGLSIAHKQWRIVLAPKDIIRLTLFEIALLIGSVIATLLFVFGALHLNQGGSGLISFMAFLCVPTILVILFWRSPQIKSWVAVSSVWLLALGLLLSGWLRSWYVSGPDISLEYRLADIVRSNNLWSLETIEHAYNACLSVSLFAPALAIITKASTGLIFKAIIPILYSFTVPIVYLITKQFLQKRGAIIAAGFFMAQPVFVIWWWVPIRQQLAFLLFGIILLFAVQPKPKTKSNLLILLLLGLGLVVAHYTTALLAIAYFIVVWLVALLLSRSKKFKDFRSPIPFAIIVLLIATYFLWYAQLAYGFNGVAKFATQSISEVGQLFSQDQGEKKRDLLAQINIFSNQKQQGLSFEQYADKRNQIIRKAYGERNMYASEETGAHLPQKLPSEQDDALQKLRQSFIGISKLIVVLGVAACVWLAIRKNEMTRYAAIAVSALVILAITAILPSFAVNYDLVRTYQQLLFAMAGIFSLALVLPEKFRKLGSIVLISFVAVYFVLTSNMLAFLYSSPSVPANLANSGNEYTYRYTQKADILMGEWITKNTEDKSTVLGDGLARDRLRLTLDPNRSQAMLNTVLPSAIPRKSYVIKHGSNIKTEAAYDTYENKLFVYKYPSTFLMLNKNIVYSNANAQLFY